MDDLTLEYGSCSNGVDCDFEEGGLCDWRVDGHSTPYWQLYDAQHGVHGVLVDHTLNSNLGEISN